MTNPATQPAAPRPLGFGFGFGRPPAQVTASGTPPQQSNEVPPVQAHTTTPTSAGAAVTMAIHPGTALPSTTSPASREGDATLDVPAEHERIAVMLGNGGREGLIFGGVFGRMEEGKFRTDEALKSIYLLQLVDGAEPGAGMEQVQRDLLAAMGGLPEVTVVSVPAELASSFKATLAAISGQRWEQMYAGVAGSSNPMVKFALGNEQRIAQEAVARVVGAGGTPFTVQIATPKRLRYTDVANVPQDDELDEYLPASGLHFVMESPSAPAVTSVLPGPLVEMPTYEEFLNASSAGRGEGDVVSFNLVESFSVIATDATAAERIYHLVPQSLKHSAWTVSNMQVNGEALDLRPAVDDEDPATDAPR